MLIMICINIFLFIGYKAGLCGTCFSPTINILAKIAGDTNINWTDVLSSITQATLQSLPIIGILITVMIALSALTGSVNVSLTGVGGGGGGFGTVHALTIVAIIIFMNFVAMPDITCMGFPTINGFGIIDFIVRIIFGSLIVVSVFGLLRGE
jgi:hypothetical protein